jgi:hypothetical protein
MFVLAWTSGHIPPRTMYFIETVTGWGTVENVNDATRFKSADAAIKMWFSKLAWPDEDIYTSAIKSGRVRAERIDQGALLL